MVFSTQHRIVKAVFPAKRIGSLFKAMGRLIFCRSDTSRKKNGAMRFTACWAGSDTLSPTNATSKEHI